MRRCYLILSYLTAVLTHLRARLWSARSTIVKVIAIVPFIWGVFSWVAEMRQAREAEQRRIAIEAVDRTRSPEFLKAYKKLREFPSRSDELTLLDDLLLIMNVYDHIALLYLFGLADECIIKKTVNNGMREISKPIGDILDAYNIASPDGFKTNFDALLRRMEHKRCPYRPGVQ